MIIDRKIMKNNQKMNSIKTKNYNKNYHLLNYCFKKCISLLKKAKAEYKILQNNYADWLTQLMPKSQ